MRNIWKKRKAGILGGIAVAVVLAAAFRVITERAFLTQAGMEGAFANLTPDESEGTVTLTGRYLPPPYGFSREKLLRHFGEQIGLQVSGEIREVSYEGRTEYVYEKNAAEAHSVIKLVYLIETGEWYLCGEIKLTGQNAAGVTGFQTQLKRVAKEMQLEDISSTLELCGIYEGEIPLGEKDTITDCLLAELYAQPIYENRENKNYTVYAYTGAVEEYLVVEKNKINVQIAIYYDRGANRTEVVLASPLGLR